MIGLVVGVVEWNRLYPERATDIFNSSNLFVESFIAITSLLGVVAIVIKYRFEATWRNYDNPVKFYRKIIRTYVDMGLKEKSAMKEKSIYRESPFLWMAKRPKFWIEILIMIIIPLPMNSPDSIFGLQIVYMDCINWFDNSDDGFPPGSHIYRTPYLTNDFFLAFMFTRFFFVMQTIVALSPPNNKLVGKRVCHEQGIEPGFNF